LARRISDVLCVTPEALSTQGAFDGFADIDAQFHVDPHLLQSTTIPEFLGSHSKLEAHFNGIITLLSNSQNKGDRLYRQAVNHLEFPEIRQLKLGYATGTAGGKGIGHGLAQRIAATASEIISAGIKDPTIFELVGLFEDNIGADRISDMTISIVLADILQYSQRVAKNLSIKTRDFTYRNERYQLPYDSFSKKFIPLVPKEILRDLPVALDWEDVDVVAGYNRDLRNRVNRIIGKTWKQAHKRLPKRVLKDCLLSNPELINDLIKLYKDKTNKQYDFERDPAGELIWAYIAAEYSQQYPLKLALKPDAAVPILEVVKDICSHFKELVELNGLNILLYSDKKKLRHERFAQRLFYGIADAYCRANNLDISCEPNAGSGPVDFKISRGYEVKINVEVKYSSNPRLIHGYQTQLPTYNNAEKTIHSIYLVIRTTQSESGIKSIFKLHDDSKKQGMRVPQIIVIDGRIKAPASKR
jgi:hypothetical protein